MISSLVASGAGMDLGGFLVSVQSATCNPRFDFFRRAPTRGRRLVVEKIAVIEKTFTVDVIGSPASAHQVVAENRHHETAAFDAALDIEPHSVLHVLGQIVVLEHLFLHAG